MVGRSRSTPWMQLQAGGLGKVLPERGDVPDLSGEWAVDFDKPSFLSVSIADGRVNVFASRA